MRSAKQLSMTNKDLREYLTMFPDDAEIFIGTEQLYLPIETIAYDHEDNEIELEGWEGEPE